MSIVKKITQMIKKEYSRCAAIIVAAGNASRMKGTDKILASLAGEPVLTHTIRAFQNSSVIHEIIVVTREDLLSQISRLCQVNGFDKVSMIVPGGATRVASVMNGLDHVSKKNSLIAVHDGARPFITEELIERTVRKAEFHHAAAPAVPVKDTIKIADNGIVTDTPDRSKLYAVQTPQVFDCDLLRGALQCATEKNLKITDDCSAVEALGMSVFLTTGDDDNIKITTPSDLILAEAIMDNRRKQ